MYYLLYTRSKKKWMIAGSIPAGGINFRLIQSDDHLSKDFPFLKGMSTSSCNKQNILKISTNQDTEQNSHNKKTDLYNIY